MEPVVLLLASRAAAANLGDKRTIDRLVVALTEAITNAIVHGNFGLSSELKAQPGGAFLHALSQKTADAASVGRIVDVRFDGDAGRGVWTITDEGEGFDVAKALKKLESDQPEDALCFGRGIPVMQAFVDDVRWSEGGRRVRLVIGIGAGSENRIHPRHKYTSAIGIREPLTAFRHEAIARDLSGGGIAFVMSQPLTLGAEVSVILDLDLTTQWIAAGRVIRCHPLAGSNFDIGVKFHEPNPRESWPHLRAD